MRLLLVAVAVILGGCVTNGRRCPDSNQTPCMSSETCSYDAANACQRCRCTAADVPMNQNPEPGHGPDFDPPSNR